MMIRWGRGAERMQMKHTYKILVYKSQRKDNGTLTSRQTNQMKTDPH